MQFLGEFGKIVCSRPPPLEGSRPPLGEILDPSLVTSKRIHCILQYAAQAITEINHLSGKKIPGTQVVHSLNEDKMPQK